MMDDRSDKALARAAQRGDADAFAELTRRHWSYVYSIAYSMLSSHAAAEDVAQDTFLRAYERLYQLRSPEKFAVWLCRIARSYVYALGRRGRHEFVGDVDGALPDSSDRISDQERFEAAEDLHNLVDVGLKALPDSLRLPLVMRYMTGASYAEIAERLAVSPAGARMRVLRARRALREYFQSNGMSDDCRDLLRSHLTLVAVAADRVAAVRARAESFGPPVAARAGGLTLLGSAALACGVVAIAFLGSMAALVADGENDGDALVVVPVGILLPADLDTNGLGSATITQARRTTESRVIVHERFAGEEQGEGVPGWTSGVWYQNTDVPPGGGLGAAVVDTNIPPAYFDFPPAQGIVTIEVWLKPHPGRDANMMFGVGNRDPRRTLNEDGRYDGTLLWKNDEGVWYHKAAYHPSVPTEASGANVPFDHYDGKWTRFTVVYNTAANVYDAYMGDEMLFARALRLLRRHIVRHGE